MPVDSLQLRYFSAVATLGSLNKAANRLNIAQSALSRRMAQLEYDLNVKLFSRSTSGIELTAEGRRLLSRATSLAEELNSLGAMVKSSSVSFPPDTMLVGMTSSASNLTLSQLVLRCSQRIPEAMLRINEGTGRAIQEDLLRGTVEVGIDRYTIPDPRIAAKHLWSETLLLVGPRKCSARELETLPFVHAAREPEVFKIIETQLSRLKLRPKSIAQVTPATSVKRLIKEGATSILPYTMLFDRMEREQFEIVPIKGVRLQSHMIWLRDEPRREPIQRFCAILEELVAEMILNDQTGFLAGPST